MSYDALMREVNVLSDKDEWMDSTALRLAAMKVYVRWHEKNQTSANKKADKIWEHAFSEQESRDKK